MVLPGQLHERRQRLGGPAFDDGRRQRARGVDGHDVAPVFAQHGDRDVEIERGAHALQDKLEEVHRAERALGFTGGVTGALREEHRRGDYTRGTGTPYRRFADGVGTKRRGHKHPRAHCLMPQPVGHQGFLMHGMRAADTSNQDAPHVTRSLPPQY